MERNELVDVLSRLSSTRIGVVGDFCLDGYWECDFSGSEISVETGLSTHAVRTQRYGLGGAGNVAANLASLGVGLIECFGVIGHDPFGRQMEDLFSGWGIGHGNVLVQEVRWATHTYIKPIDGDVEGNRLDLGNFNVLADELAMALLDRLESRLEGLDVVIVNQQVRSGIHSSKIFSMGLKSLLSRHGESCFLLDSRSMCGFYGDAICKLNTYEAMKLLGKSGARPDAMLGLTECKGLARELFELRKHPIVLTCGERGCLVADAEDCRIIPAVRIEGKTDTVGAGDSLLAGVAAGLAAGCTLPQAASLGNLAAGVTVQKLHQAGTATAEEVLAIGSKA